jgi:predicted ATPase
MLSHVSIHNYGCFVGFTLELPRRLLIVGSNGSGKTRFWEALAGLQDVIVRGVDVETAFPTRSLTRWLPDDPGQQFAIDVELGAETFRYVLAIVHDRDRRTAAIRREQLSIGGRPLYENVDGYVILYGDESVEDVRARFPFNRKRSCLADLELREDTRHTLAFRDAVASMWLLAPAPRRLEPTTTNEALWLDRDGKNFASWFRGVLVERPELGNELLEVLRPTLPGLHKVGFERVSSEIRELMLTFRAGGSDYKLSAAELSDGQRTLLLLHGFLLGALDRAALAFVDEPETGLAPHEMQPWLSAMSSALDKHDGQAFVISHHPAIVDYMAPRATIRFSRPGGGPARAEEVTLETTGGTSVSEWLSRPWAYEDEHEEPAP